MAKWGEGDPRWIVEERPDATNVNNWHWTEKNATSWSQDKLKQLLCGLKLEDSQIGSCEISEVDKIEGDAFINNRKGKLIFFYDWHVEMKWRGTIEDGIAEVNGRIVIPNLSDENSLDDLDISVTVDGSGEEEMKLKEFVRKSGAEKIREEVGKYINSLKNDFTSGMILTKEKETGNSRSQTANSVYKPAPPVKDACSQNSSDLKKMNLGTKISTGTIRLTENMKCTASEIYNVFTLTEMVQAFTLGPAELDVKIGGEFRLLNGNISGTFMELIPEKKIVQKWRHKSWPSGHFSKVTLEFTDANDSTSLVLTQTDVPSSELDCTRQGWQNYYWNPIKRTFGFGASLY